MINDPVVGPRVEFREMDAEHCAASWGNLYINIWTGRTTLSAAQQIGTTVAELLARHPEGVAIWGVSRPDAQTLPDPEVRELLARMLHEHGQKLLGVASSIEGSGFVAAAKRTAMASISLFARQPAPLKITANPGEAAQWLVPRLCRAGTEVTAVQLLDVLHQVETHYQTHLDAQPTPLR